MARGKAARTVVEASALLAAMLALSWLVFRHTLYTPAPGPMAKAEQARADEAIVVAVVGEVVRLSPGAQPSALVAGQRLLPEDSLRTGRGARTDLVMGAGSRLTVAEGTQLTVREITEKVHRFKLARGRVAVDYAERGGRVLRIESDSGGAVAETEGARFGMLSTGATVAIATESGAVRLTAQGARAIVPAGYQATAQVGQAPSAAEPIPARLLLKIAEAPQTHAVEGFCAEVSGTAPRGAEATVDGVRAEVAEDGRFHVRVPRAAGKTSFQVAIRDASGRSTARKLPCAAARPQIEDLAIEWKRRRR